MNAILKYYCAMILGLLCLAFVSGCHPQGTHTLTQAVHDTFLLRQTVHDTTLHTQAAELVEVFRTDTLHHHDTLVRENTRVRIERVLLPGGVELIKVDCKADSLRAELIETQTRLSEHEKLVLPPLKPPASACHPFREFLWGIGIGVLLAIVAPPLWKFATARIPFFRS